MGIELQFESALAAFDVARERAAAAIVVEQHALNSVIHLAVDRGLSIRETATYLRMPKSTVARHKDAIPDAWRDVAVGSETYAEAHNAAWAHDQPQQLDASASARPS